MLYIIQNDPEVPLGNYADALTTFSIPYQLIHAFRGEPLPTGAGCSALLVLGGAMGVNDTAAYPFLCDVKRCIKAIIDDGVPYLGLCLGGQLLANVAGARVITNRWEELGTLTVQLTDAGRASPLFTGISPVFPTFQWHHDSFDLPPGSTLLAMSQACPNQAFRLGATAFGLQFHPEMLESIVTDWCRWPPTIAAETDRYLTEFAEAKAEYLTASVKILENFLKLAGLLQID